MLGLASVDAHRLAIKTQLAGVAGGTGNIQKLIFTARILMTREAYRQVARIVRVGLLRRVDRFKAPYALAQSVRQDAITLDVVRNGLSGCEFGPTVKVGECGKMRLNT